MMSLVFASLMSDVSNFRGGDLALGDFALDLKPLLNFIIKINQMCFFLYTCIRNMKYRHWQHTQLDVTVLRTKTLQASRYIFPGQFIKNIQQPLSENSFERTTII